MYPKVSLCTNVLHSIFAIVPATSYDSMSVLSPLPVSLMMMNSLSVPSSYSSYDALTLQHCISSTTLPAASRITILAVVHLLGYYPDYH